MECAVLVADGHDGISSLCDRLSVAHGPPQSGCVTITSAYGLDVMVAYTETSIDPAGCAYTSYGSGRVFMSVTKAF